MKVKFKNDAANRMYRGKFAPETEHSAGYDLRVFNISNGNIETGISVAIPTGFVGIILPRSGLGFKYSFALRNTAGVIDADYRGEILLAPCAQNGHEMALKQSSEGDLYLSIRGKLGLQEEVQLHTGDRVAQMIIVPCDNAPAEVVQDLPASERGCDGIGSTGR